MIAWVVFGWFMCGLLGNFLGETMLRSEGIKPSPPRDTWIALGGPLVLASVLMVATIKGIYTVTGGSE